MENFESFFKHKHELTGNESPSEHKQVLVVSKFLGMNAGKIASQTAHASVKALTNEGFIYKPTEHSISYLAIPLDDNIGPWLLGVFTKAAVVVNSEEEFWKIYYAAIAAKIPCSAIQDIQMTKKHKRPIHTAMAIGPAHKSLIDPITGHLELLKNV